MEKKQYVLALGFFDGVHRGHARLLDTCRAMAGELQAEAGVVTFSDHPDTLVLGKTPALISAPRDKELLMEAHGIDRVFFLPFDRAMMTMPWQDFFRMLCEDYHAVGLVCGEDFRFGDRGQGTAALLQEACEKRKMRCAVIPQQFLDGTVISSTYIRTLLERGEMEKANRFLGHPCQLTGRVVSGKHLGHTIGIPTANLIPPEGLVTLRFGVYACKVCFDGAAHPAVVNVGTRPTVSGENVTVEAWILDYDGDLYGREITLRFYRFLRPERKFQSMEDLRREILHNAEETKAFFENGKNT